MKTTENNVPFIIGNMERVDEELYKNAINKSIIIKEAYSPESQTSNISAYGGSSLTYCDTDFLPPHDQKQCDT